MNKTEKTLVLELARFLTTDREKLKTTLPTGATPAVLGHLFFNRTAGLAFDVLRTNGLTDGLNREFRNSLQGAYEQNAERNNSFFSCLKLVSDVLTPCKEKYAMLKGAMLCGSFPSGTRTSNDIDLLTTPEDVSDIGDALRDAGFRQGRLRNGVFVPAERREIIDSRLNRGETVPYFLHVGLPYLPYLEVDVNFSPDCKNGDPAVVRKMLGRPAECLISDGIVIRTLDQTDFFLHLCAHLYKEAATLPWVKMRRDLSLYKFCDIYYYLCILNNADIDAAFARAAELDLADTCAAVILWTENLLPAGNTHALQRATEQLAGKEEMTELVYDPGAGKTYRYTEQDIRKRFFASDRMKLLEEVAPCEN